MKPWLKRIITDALTKETGATINEKVYKAFRTLQARRRSKEWVNVELAAAEHYMYARFPCWATGDPSFILPPNWYNLKKKVFFELDIQSLNGNERVPRPSALR
jgi:hypothetical protein